MIILYLAQKVLLHRLESILRRILIIFTCINYSIYFSFFLFLSKWLRAIPSTTQTFNRLRGDCPYCNNVNEIFVVRFEIFLYINNMFINYLFWKKFRQLYLS